MTHRDRAGDASGQWAGSREAAGPAGHRQGFPTPPRAPAAGSPARPERRLPKAFGRRPAWLAMPCIAAPRAPGRKSWEAVSLGLYQRSLVSDPFSAFDRPGDPVPAPHLWIQALGAPALPLPVVDQPVV